jgi:UrcA family protein
VIGFRGAIKSAVLTIGSETMKTSTTLTVTFALGAVLLGGTASAAEDRASVKVTYGAEAVANPDRAEDLLRRLSEAALEACGASQDSVPDYRWAVTRSACYQNKLSQAVADVESPILSRVYRRDGQAYTTLN